MARLDQVIKIACKVDYAGEAVLEFLLSMPEQELTILGIRNVCELIAISTWYLWWERRKLVHKEKTQDANQISMGIRAITLNYVLAISPKATMKRGGWVQPPRGFVKLNVDAAYDSDSLQATVGVVLRDSSGKFLAAGDCVDALMAEATALRFGLNLAQSFGCSRLIINSDVIAAMQDGGVFSGLAAAIFDDCYHMARDLSQIH